MFVCDRGQVVESSWIESRGCGGVSRGDATETARLNNKSLAGGRAQGQKQSVKGLVEWKRRQEDGCQVMYENSLRPSLGAELFFSTDREM